MKKAKLIIVGLALFTTVSAALAFKASKMNGTYFCTSIQGAACATNSLGMFNRFAVDFTNGQLSYCTTNSADCSTVLVADEIQVIGHPR